MQELSLLKNVAFFPPLEMPLIGLAGALLGVRGTISLLQSCIGCSAGPVVWLCQLNLGLGCQWPKPDEFPSVTYKVSQGLGEFPNIKLEPLPMDRFGELFCNILFLCFKAHT